LFVCVPTGRIQSFLVSFFPRANSGEGIIIGDRVLTQLSRRRSATPTTLHKIHMFSRSGSTLQKSFRIVSRSDHKSVQRRYSLMSIKLIVAGISVLSLAACAQPGAESAANVYTQGEVNTRQNAEVVQVLAVMPAKVQVSNAQNQRVAQIAGGILGAAGGAGLGAGLASPHNAFAAGTVGAVGGGVVGAAAGSLVPPTVLVDGVSITYTDHGHTFNSAQVGRLCEYGPGQAIMVSSSPTETRIQPNETCPPPTKGA
jgi:outer membrane lipoprotein SlyB